MCVCTCVHLCDYRFKSVMTQAFSSLWKDVLTWEFHVTRFDPKQPVFHLLSDPFSPPYPPNFNFEGCIMCVVTLLPVSVSLPPLLPLFPPPSSLLLPSSSSPPSLVEPQCICQAAVKLIILLPQCQCLQANITIHSELSILCWAPLWTELKNLLTGY